ncbi:MAG: amidohydrolase [Anaerolineae bacterium]
MRPDLILVNANVRTLDSSRPRAQALVFRGGEIIYVGDDRGALAYRTHLTELIDAHGQLVLPGLIDSHLHFCGWAQGLDRVNLEGCRSLDEAVARVAARIPLTRPGEIIHGWGWNHLDWNTPVFPDRRSLDAVAPNTPVFLTRKDGHSAWVNSAMMKQAGITRDTPNPEGGRLERDADGEPNGLIRENAMELLGKGIGQSDEEIPLDALKRAIAYAHRAGLTGVHSIEGPNALRAWQTLHTRGEMDLRVVHAIPDTHLDHALTLGIQRGLGDEWLRLQAVKIFADGSLGSQTAEMFEPFTGSDKRGMALTDSKTMLELARKAARGGIDIWTHAIGDQAISRTLSVFETLRAEGFTNVILRIEHVQHLAASDIPRFKAANVIASVQPIHQTSDMRMVDALLGPTRARYTYVFNSLRQAGATLAFGSDCPVEGLEPLRGIHAAVTRQNAESEPAGGWVPEERLSVQAAVEGFTTGAAASVGDQHRAGTLSVGKRADAVILSQDIFGIPPREILNTQVSYTIVGGKVVYHSR